MIILTYRTLELIGHTVICAAVQRKPTGSEENLQKLLVGEVLITTAALMILHFILRDLLVNSAGFKYRNFKFIFELHLSWSASSLIQFLQPARLR